MSLKATGISTIDIHTYIYVCIYYVYLQWMYILEENIPYRRYVYMNIKIFIIIPFNNIAVEKIL